MFNESFSKRLSEEDEKAVLRARRFLYVYLTRLLLLYIYIMTLLVQVIKLQIVEKDHLLIQVIKLQIVEDNIGHVLGYNCFCSFISNSLKLLNLLVQVIS